MCRWDTLSSAFHVLKAAILSLAIVFLTIGCGDKPGETPESETASTSASDEKEGPAADGSPGQAATPESPSRREDNVPADLRPLVAQLNDSDASNRGKAAVELMEMGPPARAAVPALIKRALHDESGHVRALAAGAAVKIDPTTKEQVVPQLMRDLKDSDGKIRRRAAGVLGFIGPPPESIAPLRELLDDENEDARREAISALVMAGPVAIDAVAGALNSKDEHTKRVALSGLKLLGRPAMPYLIKAMEHEDVNVRKTALGILAADFDSLDEGAIPPLSAALNDSDPGVRGMAVRALAKTGDVGIPSLVEALDSEDKVVRQLASMSLAKIGAAGIPTFVEALDSEHEDNRQAAVMSLAKIGEPAREALYNALGHKDHDVQMATLLALQTMGDVGISILGEALSHPDEVVRREAARILSHIAQTNGKAVVPIFMKALGNDDPMVQATAITTLGLQGDDALPALRKIAALAVTTPEEGQRIQVIRSAQQAVITLDPAGETAVPLLLQALKHPDEKVRLATVQFLGLYGPKTKSVVPGLIESLTDESESVQFWAVDGLRKAGPNAVDASDTLAAMALQNTKTPAEHRLKTAAREIALIADPDGTVVVPIWIKALTDRDDQVRLTAVELLGAYGPKAKDAVPQLIRCLKDQNPGVRLAAISTFGKIGPDAEKAVRPLTGIVRLKKEPAAAKAEAALKLIKP